MSEFKVPKRIKKAKKKKNIPPITNILIIFFSFSLAFVVAFYLYLMSLPPIKNLDDFKPNIVTKFYSHDGEIIKTFTAFTFSRVALKDVPANLKNGLISTEDKNFYKHQGFDIFGLMRSTLANVVAGRVVQGASTLSQQLARILFLNNEKTMTRKIKELIVAVQIEKTLDKDQILEMYLNNVYLGSGAYGVEGAAQIYFNKHVKDLTLAECALIAGLPQAPSVYSPFHSKDLAIKRRNKVLRRMLTMKYITKEQYSKAIKEELKLNPLPQIYTLNKAPYFCDYVMKDLEKLGFDETEISHGGYKIITTLDSKAQQVANTAIPKIMNSWGLVGDKRQAALLSINPHDGRILAYVGGKDYTKSQYDRVTQAIRPPGSAFKPIVYATAVEKGVTPNDLIDDKPFTAGDWSPKNYGNKYRGAIPVYKALMVSSNVAAARLIELTGVRPVIQMARVMGISTPLQYDYTIALGSNGVKLFEFVRAYGVFANSGYRVDLYAIERIESSRGKILYQAPETHSTKVMDTNTAAIMTAMMKTVIKSGTGIAANIGKPAAGKTGTTDDSRDAYFVGYTPDVVTGVWVGNDDNTKNGKITGGTVPALIWKEVMKVATEQYGNKDFSYDPIDLQNYSSDKAVEVSEQVVNNIDEAVEQVRKQNVEEVKETKKEQPKKDDDFDIPVAMPSEVRY